MSAQVDVNESGITVDARLIADAFGLDPAEIQGLMRNQDITSRCEQGVDEDAGRWRITFWYGERAVRLTLNESGEILSRARFPAPRRGRDRGRT